jgi:glucan phosphorylase
VKAEKAYIGVGIRAMIVEHDRKDPYLLLADYQSYIEAQNRVSQAYRDQDTAKPHTVRPEAFVVRSIPI